MVIQPLDTADNKLIRHVRRVLSSRQTRDRDGETVVEGARIVQEAVEAGAELVSVLYSTRFVSHDRGRSMIAQVMALRARVIYVTDRLLDDISDVEHHQGILAVVRYRIASRRLLPVPPNGPMLAVVAEALQDPGNLGSIIRSAQAAGVHAIGVTGGTVDVLNPKTLRASAGSVFRLPVVALEEGWLDAHREAGIAVRAAVVDGGMAYDQVDWTGPCLLVLGNEGRGVDALTLSRAERVTVPMAPEADSLNVSVAGAVMLFHAAFRRRQAGVGYFSPAYGPDPLPVSD
ncbi:MAG: RNA methyltransferase [Thermaerobacter sp.]|nr:RNA methyltransferase [Thermaerobacter sp.]